MAKQVPPPPPGSVPATSPAEAPASPETSSAPDALAELKSQLDVVRTELSQTKEANTALTAQLKDLTKQNDDLKARVSQNKIAGSLNEHPLFQLYLANLGHVNDPSASKVLERSRQQLEFLAKELSS